MLRKSRASAAPIPSGPERLTKLSELCSEAATHVARARIALSVETADTDQALAHLDEAIGCLRRLVAYNLASQPSRTVHALRTA